MQSIEETISLGGMVPSLPRIPTLFFARIIKMAIATARIPGSISPSPKTTNVNVGFEEDDDNYN
jgi:hypothetical protein